MPEFYDLTRLTIGFWTVSILFIRRSANSIIYKKKKKENRNPKPNIFIEFIQFGHDRRHTIRNVNQTFCHYQQINTLMETKLINRINTF